MPGGLSSSPLPSAALPHPGVNPLPLPLVLQSRGCPILESVMLLALGDEFCLVHFAAFVLHAAPTVAANLPCPARQHQEFVLVLMYRG